MRKLIFSVRYIPIFFILVYRNLISPLFPASCRFYPSCSKYAIDAYRKYGIIKGTILTFKRILRCHPFHPGGYDPVL